jgi:hypothetical protein
MIFVYTLGPDWKREFTAWEIRGDDVGATIFELEP